MTGWLRRWWLRLRAVVDDTLPMPVDQRAERDWSPESGEAVSARGKLRLRLHMFEKRGKGGYR